MLSVVPREDAQRCHLLCWELGDGEILPREKFHCETNAERFLFSTFLP